MFQKTLEICLIAVRNNEEAFEFVPPNLEIAMMNIGSTAAALCNYLVI